MLNLPCSLILLKNHFLTVVKISHQKCTVCWRNLDSPNVCTSVDTLSVTRQYMSWLVHVKALHILISMCLKLLACTFLIIHYLPQEVFTLTHNYSVYRTMPVSCLVLEVERMVQSFAYFFFNQATKLLWLASHLYTLLIISLSRKCQCN